MPTALITGITGQDGSYLAELLLAKGYLDPRPLLPEQGRKGCEPDRGPDTMKAAVLLA